MSVTITVGNETFEYPSNGQSPGYGQAATETIQAIADAVASLSGPDDILLTSFTIANNQTSFTNILGLGFDTSTVRAANITYSVYRTTNSNNAAETGTIQVVYNSAAASWEINREFAGDAGITFQITAGGLLQYKSSNISGSSYSGVIKFLAKTLPQ